MASVSNPSATPHTGRYQFREYLHAHRHAVYEIGTFLKDFPVGNPFWYVEYFGRGPWKVYGPITLVSTRSEYDEYGRATDSVLELHRPGFTRNAQLRFTELTRERFAHYYHRREKGRYHTEAFGGIFRNGEEATLHCRALNAAFRADPTRSDVLSQAIDAYLILEESIASDLDDGWDSDGLDWELPGCPFTDELEEEPSTLMEN